MTDREYELYFPAALKAAYELHHPISADLTPDDLYRLLGWTRWGSIKGTIMAQFYEAYDLYHRNGRG